VLQEIWFTAQGVIILLIGVIIMVTVIPYMFYIVGKPLFGAWETIFLAAEELGALEHF
jgi:hypothetical protein